MGLRDVWVSSRLPSQDRLGQPHSVPNYGRIEYEPSIGESIPALHGTPTRTAAS